MSNLRALSATQQRAIIYLRQSHYREESISLELQELACRDYCDRMGYLVTAVEADPGISGRTWNRPKVQVVMRAIEERTADVVVLWKWSRLSRSRKDWALAIDKADVAGGRIESATEPLDTATASGRFARGVMTEYAAFQSEQIGEQWEEVRQRRLRLGLPASGRLPYGWRWANGGVEQHPEQAPHVVSMYQRYLNGDGAAAIARWLNTHEIPGPNGNAWTRPRPLTVMDSPIHTGLIPYRGQTYDGAHEPLISRGTWDTYRAERQRRLERQQKPREYRHLLSQLMHCECGSRMHGKGSITGGHWYGGYLCPNTLNSHEQRAYISALAADPAVKDWLFTLDPEVDATPPVTSTTVRRDTLLREVNALETDLVGLTRQTLRDIMPEATYARTLAEIHGEIESKNAELQRLAPPAAAPPTADDLMTLRRAWPEMTTPEKNRGLRKVADSIHVLDDGTRLRIATAWGTSSVVTV